jgi:hypothetical protein
MKIKSSYSVKKWDEQTFKQLGPDQKITKASVEYKMEGDLQGIAAVEYLMFYQHFNEKDPHAATATYVGLVQFEGTIKNKKGSFVMEDNGTFEGGTALSKLRILDKSGSGDLADIRGSGGYRADKTGCTLVLDCEL